MGLRLAAIAAVSAAVTATIVIGVGRGFLPEAGPASPAPPGLIHTAAR